MTTATIKRLLNSVAVNEIAEIKYRKLLEGKYKVIIHVYIHELSFIGRIVGFLIYEGCDTSVDIAERMAITNFMSNDGVYFDNATCVHTPTKDRP